MPPRAQVGLPELSATTRNVVSLLLRSGPMPRVNLALRLALTLASLTKLTRPMLETGLLEEPEPLGHRATGHSLQPLSVNRGWATFRQGQAHRRLDVRRPYQLCSYVIASSDTSLRGNNVAATCDRIIDQVNYLSASWAANRNAPPPPTLSDVGELARSGDQVVVGAPRGAGYAIGCLVGTICNIEGPARVILSGEAVVAIQHHRENRSASA